MRTLKTRIHIKNRNWFQEKTRTADYQISLAQTIFSRNVNVNMFQAIFLLLEEVLDLDLSFELHLDAMLHGKTSGAAVIHLWINDIFKSIMPVGKRRSYYVLKQIRSF